MRSYQRAQALSPRAFARDECVRYLTRGGLAVDARVLCVHREADPPYYTIICHGEERQTEASRLKAVAP